MHNKSILIVDDTSKIRQILSFTLEQFGFRTYMANNGQEALDFDFANHYIDLIILDIMMPKVDGYEVIQQLKQNELTKKIPILFLTAKAQRNDVVKGIELGADAYMVKPYKLWELHRKVEQLIFEKGK